MKKTVLTVAIIATLCACHKELRHDDDQQLPGLSDDAIEVATTETELSSLSEALEVNIDYLTGASELMETHAGTAKSVCPTITITREGQSRFPQTVIVEYGDGCKGKRNHDITGTISIYKSASWIESGATRTITFQDFTIDGVSVSGTKTISYDGVTNGIYNFSVSSDLTFTWNDGYWVNRVQNKTRSFIAGIDTPDDEEDDVLQITGNVTDTDSNGTILSKVITEPLVLQAGCDYFVSGIIAVSKNNELLFTFDYGDGTCDMKATISKNGDSRDILLNKTRGR